MDKTKRLFWALGLSDELKLSMSSQLKKTQVSAKKKNMDVRWTPSENFHVTLRFLGEVFEEKIPELTDLAAPLAEEFAPFELKIKGAGAFPDLKAGRVLWLGVQAKKELVSLQAQLAGIMGGDFELEQRDYIPHLTIGRLKSKRNLEDTLSPIIKQDFGKVQGKEIVLYESKMAGNFPQYIPLRRIVLRGEGPEKI